MCKNQIQKDIIMAYNNNEKEEKSIIIGRNPVIEALKAKKNIDTLYVSKEGGGSIGLICKMAAETRRIA